MSIKPLAHLGHIPDAAAGKEIDLSQRIAHAFLDGGLVAFERLSEKENFPLVRVHQIHQRLQRGGFSRAVPAHKAHYRTGRH